jgi:hypothetical protein
VKTTVWATVDLPGFHCWPTAPPRRAYLRDRHRHLFRVTAEVAVSHDDRDVEFHDLADLIRAWWAAESDGALARECGPKSCEALANELGAALAGGPNLAVTRITVSEDGECGATITPELQGHPPP